MESYLKGMFEKFAYMATWLPSAPVTLGDVGFLSGGSFQRVTSLANLGIEFAVRKGTTALDLSHSSDQGASLMTSGGAGAEAGPSSAKAKVSVEFTSMGAFVFQAKGCVESTIEDQAKLAREVIARFKSGEDWDPDWVVINTVVRSKSATILVSSSTTSKIDIGATTDLPAGSTPLASADLGLHVLGQTGDMTNIIAQQALTPMFRVSRVKRDVLARIQSALFGTTKFENVRSIGPQVFSAGDEPDPVEIADEDAFEDVRPW